ncbi:MAG: hypothetical protein EA377_01975 [Phycisphaerales bacterium]|nr:MAG: hypothetical protein EA377_01975 [Phycisphaerales bacterium]
MDPLAVEVQIVHRQQSCGEHRSIITIQWTDRCVDRPIPQHEQRPVEIFVTHDRRQIPADRFEGGIGAQVRIQPHLA